MRSISQINLDLGDKNQTYFKLLKEEDFDFKTKDIKISVELKDQIEVQLETSSILDLKIATTALIKSLEVIEKTLKV
jgi:hypothetical protein